MIGEEIAHLGFVAGQVAAVLVYDRALDQEARNAVESYLVAKYLTPPWADARPPCLPGR